MYRTIDTALWSDPAVRKLKSAGKLLFLYLITNPHAHVSGIYYLPESYIVHDTGLTEDILDRAWDTLSEPCLALRDKNLDIIWVCNMFHHQGRGDRLHRAAANHLRTLHNSELIKQFLQRYPQVKKHFPDRVSKGYPRHAPKEQEQEQDINTPLTPQGGDAIKSFRKPRASRSATSEGFEEFWAAYPRKQGKEAARKEWQVLSPDAALRAVLMTALARQKLWPQWLSEGGRFVPYPRKWLHGRQWEDEPAGVQTGLEPGSISEEEIAAKLQARREADRLEEETCRPSEEALERLRGATHRATIPLTPKEGTHG